MNFRTTGLSLLVITLLGSVGSLSLQQIPFGFFRKAVSPFSDKLVFTTSSQTIGAGDCSGITTVQSQNVASAPLNVASNLTVNLTPSTGLSFYSDSLCLTAITSVTITTGTNSANFYFISDVSGTKATAVSAASYNGGTQNQTISANAYIWTGGGGDANWTTGANWSGGAAPATTSHTAYFVKTCAANCSPNIDTDISIKGIKINAGFTGTITQTTTRTITLASDGWTQKGGVFAGGDSAITMNGPFYFGGGSFTATSSTWTMKHNYQIAGSPTFNANNGTILFQYGSNYSLDPGTVNYKNISICGTGSSVGLTLAASSVMNVLGDLSLESTYTGSAGLYQGTIEVSGNLNISNYSAMGSTNIKLIGATDSLISATSTKGVSFLEIAKDSTTNPAVKVTVSGTLRIDSFSANVTAYTQTSGAVDYTTNSASLSFENGGNITPGSINYFNVAFGAASGRTYTLAASSTMNVLGVLALSASYTGSNSLANGTIEAKGDVTATNYGIISTTTVVRLSGSGNQTVSGVSTANIPNFEIASTGGTVTYSGSLLFQGDYTYASGSISTGTSTATFAKNAGSAVVTPGSTAFYNVTFGGATSAATIVGTMTVNGTLTFDDASGSGIRKVDGGTIVANGNVVFANYGKSGTVAITFGGSSNTTLTVGASAQRPSGTITIAKTGSATLTLASAASFGSAGQNVTVSTGTLSLASYALTVTNTLTVSLGAKLICGTGSAIAATYVFNGEVVCGTTFGITWIGTTGDNLWGTAGNWSGGVVPTASDVALFNGSCTGANCNANINSNISVLGIDTKSTYTGTQTQNSTRTMTVGSSGWSHAGGTFAGGDSAITLGGNFALSGGTFTSTSATLTQNIGSGTWSYLVTGSPTFNHNSGTIAFNCSTTSTRNLTVGTTSYYNVSFLGNGLTTSLSDVLTVSNTLTISDTSSGNLNGGTIEAKGNVTASNNGKGGSTQLRISGNTNQTINGSAAANYFPNFEIASTGGTVTLAGTLRFWGTNYTYTSGTLNTGTSIIMFHSNGTASNTFTPGTTPYYDVNFSGFNYTTTVVGTLTVNGTLTVADTYSGGGSINGGTILAMGNVSFGTYGKYGSTLIKIAGSTNQTVTGTSNAAIPKFEVASTGGTVTYAGTLSFAGNYTYTSGVVDAGTSTVKFSTSQTVVPGTVAYYNATFVGYTSNITLSGTMNVNGLLSLAGTSASPPASISGGTIAASGDVTIGSNGMSGSTLVKLVGSGNQTLSGISSGVMPALEIASTGGTVSVSSTVNINGAYTYTSGTVINPAVSNLT